MSCAASATWASRSGRWRWTRRWCARTSTPPVPGASQSLVRAGGAGSNDKDPGPGREALGRSRGGLTTKIHLAADIRCRPVSRVTTVGQRHDSVAFESVLAGVRVRRRERGRARTRPDRVLCDKAYSSKAIRAYLRRRGIRATIPEPADQQGNRARRGSAGGRPPQFDPGRYKLRNVVERSINKLKQFRAVATRYDKREYVFQGTIDVASIRIWLRDPVP
jgi:transposase